MAEKITVIVPVYNIEEELPQCVASLLAQTYENLEILLVDDGSTDSSGTQCDAFAREDARVRVLHKENGGLSSARNAGLCKAQGAFIAFVDGDDAVAHTMYESLYRLLKVHGADCSMCRMLQVDKQGNPLERYDSKEIKELLLTGEEVLQGYFAGFEEETHVAVTVCNKLYRKNLFDGLRFEQGRCFEDSFIGFDLITRCSSLALTTAVGYYYRNRASSISHQIGSYGDFIVANDIRYRRFAESFPHLEKQCRGMTLRFFLCAARSVAALGEYSQGKAVLECIRESVAAYSIEDCSLSETEKRELAVLARGSRGYYILYKAYGQHAK